MPATPYDNNGLNALPHALLWGACLLLAGITILRLTKAHRTPSLALSFAFGAAAAVPVMAVASFLQIPRGPAGFLAAEALIAILALTGFSFSWRLHGPPRLPIRPPAGWWLLPASLAAVGCILQLPVVIRPQLSYDVLSYHIPVARHLQQSLSYIDGNYYSRLPSAAFLLYGPALRSPSVTVEAPAIRLLLWLAMVAGSLLCARIATHLGARRPARWLAAALYAWHPIVWSSTLGSNSDLLTAMFALAATERALSGIVTGGRRTFLSAGFLAGTAVAVKFSALGITAIPLVIGILASAGGRNRSGTRIRRTLMAASLAAAGMLLAFTPWLVRSTLHGGNPLHPFLGEAPGWNSQQNEFLLEQHQPRTPLDPAYWQRAWDESHIFGLNLTFRPSDPANDLEALGISLVALLTLLAALRWRHPGTRLVLVVIAAGYGAWLTVGLAPDRFALPAIATALCLASVVALQNPRFGLRAGAGAIVSLALLFNILDLGREGVIQSPWKSEAWQRSAVIPENVHRAALRPDRNRRILMLFEARGGWFPENTLWNTVWDTPPWAEILRQSTSPADFAHRLADRAGVTHVFVNEFEWSRLLVFYGDMDRGVVIGEVSVGMARENVLEALEAYPPFRHASFSPGDLETLAEFLVLARGEATDVAPAGGTSEIWLARLPLESPSEGTP